MFFGHSISSWHFFYLLGAISIFASFSYLNKLSGRVISEKNVIDYYLVLYVSAYLGARVFSIFNDQQVADAGSFFSELVKIGPMTLYGGVLAAIILGFIYVKYKKLPVKYLLNISLVSFFIGLFFGRIGCFLNGDDYGSICLTDSTFNWLCVVFPNLNDNLLRYPVQIFSAVNALFIFIIGIILFNSKKYSNISGIFCLYIYSINRFLFGVFTRR